MPRVWAGGFGSAGEGAAVLIEDYDVEVFTPPCEPGAERYAARARLTVDISEALPYLNAILRGAVYHPAAKALTWKKGGHNVAFHAFEVATSNVEDRDAAIRELQGLITLVNRTWERRAEITPDHETHQRPTPMAVYQLLPRTNCRKCGEPTCFVFACKLAASQVEMDNCPSMLEADHRRARAALQRILVEGPSVGSRRVEHEQR